MTKVSFHKKLISWGDLPAWRAAIHANRKRLVVTNGCFDILHLGHVTCLEKARDLGDALETLNQKERRTVEQADEKITLLPFVSGKSTSALLEKISRL